MCLHLTPGYLHRKEVNQVSGKEKTMNNHSLFDDLCITPGHVKRFKETFKKPRSSG